MAKNKKILLSVLTLAVIGVVVAIGMSCPNSMDKVSANAHAADMVKAIVGSELGILGKDKVSPGSMNLALTNYQGTRVTFVHPEGLLKILNLQVGDLILSANGHNTLTPDLLNIALASFVPKNKLDIKFIRSQKIHNETHTLN